MDIIDRFENNIAYVLKTYPAETVFLAAVSGGADSMAMLAALCSLSESSSVYFKFSVLHVEHGIRPAEESRADAEFVRVFCKEKKINCRVKHIKPGRIAAFAKRKGIGLEAAARFFRHRAFCVQAALLGEQTGLTDTRILTAHTKDDALELTLMRVLRGCGPSGLAAMKTEKTVNGCSIIRPMLSLTRSDVIAYLQAKNIPWREDATNADDVFLRNRIRHQLVPLLNEGFPSWKKGIGAMAETQLLAAEFIADEARERIVLEIGSRGLYTDENIFNMQPMIIREEAIFQAIDELLKNAQNHRSVKRSVVRRFCEGAAAADLGPVQIRCEGGKIVLSRKKKEYFERGVSVYIT